MFLTKQGHRLARHLCQLTRSRHGKYQDTLFHLEPDVKETPGGLRDLHFIHWISGLRPELRPETSLKEARAFLSSLRCFLHFEAGRDRNVLNFETQEMIVQQPFSTVKTPTLWMREYFNHARMVFRETQRTLDAYEKTGQFVVQHVPRFALASIELGIHGVARAGVSAQSGALAERSGDGAAAA